MEIGERLEMQERLCQGKGVKMSRCTYVFIRASKVRQLCKENGKRCGAEFLYALDKHIQEQILKCCQGERTRKTLDMDSVKMILM